MEDQNTLTKEEDNTFLLPVTLCIVYKNILYTLSRDCSVIQYNDFVSIGSGSDFALGALEATKNMNMEPEQRVKIALEVACKFDAGCAPPFKIISKVL